MGVTVNTNMSALNAGRMLNKTQTNLSKSFERLSSGLRINRAADDAGGLKISQRLTSQIRGLDQAMRNANDGISLVQTTEGALNETSDILQRMRELSVQSANDSYTTADRQSLQDEVDALVDELDRISANTTFNGRNVLDGSFENMSLQVGADSNQTITISINGASSEDIGQVYASGEGTVTKAIEAGVNDLVINGKTIENSNDGAYGKDSDSAYSIAKSINNSDTGVRAEVATTSYTAAAATGLAASDTLSINGVEIVADAGTGMTAQETAQAINEYSTQTGVNADVNQDGKLVLTAEDGRNIKVTAGDAGSFTGVATEVVTRSSINLKSAESFTVVDANDILGLTAGGGAGTTYNDANGTSIKTIDISTAAGAQDAITSVDNALDTISTRRGELGAIQNRLESTISNLGNINENLNGARSRLLDVDFASETVQMSKGMLLQQAGASILAQAKSSNQFAVSLLQ